MLLLEIITLSQVFFWTLVLIVYGKYKKNMQEMSTNPEGLGFELNISNELQTKIEEIKVYLINEITPVIDVKIQSLQMDLKKFDHYISEFKENFNKMTNIRDELKKEFQERLGVFEHYIDKIPNGEAFTKIIDDTKSKLNDFKLPNDSEIKTLIREQIDVAFSDENIKKLTTAFMSELSEQFKGGDGELPAGLPQGGPDLSKLDFGDMFKMMAMSYMSKFMGGSNMLGGGSLPAPVSSSRNF